jgi:hypothetical protein
VTDPLNREFPYMPLSRRSLDEPTQYNPEMIAPRMARYTDPASTVEISDLTCTIGREPHAFNHDPCTTIRCTRTRKPQETPQGPRSMIHQASFKVSNSYLIHTIGTLHYSFNPSRNDTNRDRRPVVLGGPKVERWRDSLSWQ